MAHVVTAYVAMIATTKVAACGAGAGEAAIVIAAGRAALQAVAVELARVATRHVAGVRAGAVDIAALEAATHVTVRAPTTLAVVAVAVIGAVMTTGNEEAQQPERVLVHARVSGCAHAFRVTPALRAREDARFEARRLRWCWGEVAPR